MHRKEYKEYLYWGKGRQKRKNDVKKGINARLQNRKKKHFCFLLQVIYKPLSKAEETHIQFYVIL